MPKNHVMKEPEFDNDFDDLMLDDELYDDDGAMAHIMGNILGVTNQQMQMALELTKLIVDKTLPATAGAMSEEKIFTLYRQALKVVADSSPLQDFMEKLG